MNRAGVVLDTKRAAAYLGLRPQTLCNWRVYRKGPPYHRVGRRVLYLVEDLDNFLKAGRIVPGGEDAAS